MTKKASDRISDAFADLGSSLKSIVKLLTQSRRATLVGKGVDTDRPMIILGNGPSLNDTLARHLPLLQQSICMAVNFAANAPQFAEIHPRYYMMVDPYLFSGRDDVNLVRLWQSLSAVSWRMTLIVPCKYEQTARRLLDSAAGNIDILTLNAVGVEGWRWLKSLAFSHGRGMPRPRNVLVAAIMGAVQMGYREIYIVGADHSWITTISVTDDNRVISVPPHFYKDNSHEIKRIHTDYLNYRLHDVIYSFYLAFKSYHEIEAYAKPRGVKIYNATPGSFIDAFERRGL